MSNESVLSDDYAVPPDAVSADGISINSSNVRPSFMNTPTFYRKIFNSEDTPKKVILCLLKVKIFSKLFAFYVNLFTFKVAILFLINIVNCLQITGYTSTNYIITNFINHTFCIHNH